MRLSRIKIQNLRCIEEIEVFPGRFTSLIGPNNSGKSSVLRAIEIFLNQVSPDPDEWRSGFENQPIVIEADFDNLADWERVKPGVSSLVHQNQIRLRLSVLPPDAAQDRKKPELFYECYKPHETIQGWAESWGGLDDEIRTLAGELGIAGTAFRSAASKERVRQAVRERLPDRVTLGNERWSNEGISIPAAFQQALPQAQLIPAVRDASEDAAPGAKTSFGQLLRRIVLPAVIATDEYRAFQEALATLEGRLKDNGENQLPAVRQLSDKITATLSELFRARISLAMESADLDKVIEGNASLRLDDGTSTRIGLQGHGLQRALVFALLEVLASQNAAGEAVAGAAPTVRSTILLFEEPELFMHPQLMRRLAEALGRISRRPEWQVIATTHSPFLVDLAEDRRSLVIHRRHSPAVPPSVTQLRDDPLEGEGRAEERDRLRALLDFHPTVCEAFFAKRVVLVEGDTELAVLTRQSRLFQLAGIESRIVRETTVVSCDGKWTIIPIARLLKAFGVPLRVIHDIDRKGRTDEELARDPSHEFHANSRINEAAGEESVLAIDDTFEHVLSTAESPFSSKSDKPYRAWRRVRELCSEKADLTHVPRLKQAIEFAFAERMG